MSSEPDAPPRTSFITGGDDDEAVPDERARHVPLASDEDSSKSKSLDLVLACMTKLQNFPLFIV